MIRAEQVRFQYKKRDVDGNVIATEEILKGVDLTIKKGRIHCAAWQKWFRQDDVLEAVKCNPSTVGRYGDGR